jgi:hypothetical protein
MAARISVRKELHLAAPDPHVAIYAQNPTYAALDGVTLIEAVKEETRTASGRYYDRRIYRRRSEDNGRTWRVEEPLLKEVSEAQVEAGYLVKAVPMHYLDPDNGLLLSITHTCEQSAADVGFNAAADLTSRTHRFFSEISRDGGLSWEDHGQLILSGHDAVNWAPGVWYGKNGMSADMPPWAKLPDGTICMGVNRQAVDEHGAPFSATGGYFLETVILRGRWRDDLSGLDWTMGETLKVPPEQSSVGCCEPAMAHLGGNRLFVTMRCQGYPDQRCPSLKFSSLSEDGGLTWAKPSPLKFDDGAIVNSPASLAQFVRFGGSDRFFWIGNLSEEPVYAQTPRYPLYLVEFDPERLCLIRDSVHVIDDWREGLPTDVRFTNWGSYVDRETGEIVLTLPEEPKISWPDLTSDCYRYRLALEE